MSIPPLFGRQASSARALGLAGHMDSRGRMHRPRGGGRGLLLIFPRGFRIPVADLFLPRFRPAA